MKDYIVTFESRGNIKLDEPITAEFTGPEGAQGLIAATNWEDPIDDDFAAHRGLVMDVKVGASSIDEAIKSAFNVAEACLASLCAQALGSTEEAEVRWAYDVTPGESQREFRQYFEIPVKLRPVKVGHASAALELIESMATVDGASDKDRIVRAIQSLRRGFETADGLARFLEFWIGLECLNPVLQRRLKAEESHWLCECGKPYVRQELRGLKAFATEVTGEETYREIIKVRRDIFHGLAAFADAQQVAAGLAPRVENLLWRAIRFSLGMNIGDVKGLEQTSLHGYSMPRMRITATLTGAEDPGKLGLEPDQHPHFTLETSEVGVFEDGGATKQRLNHTFHPQIGCAWMINQFTTVYPKGTTANAVEAALVGEDGERIPMELTTEEEVAS